MIVFMVICLILLVFVVNWVVTLRRLNKKMQLFNGPSPWPLLGNVFDFPTTKRIYFVIDNEIFNNKFKHYPGAKGNYLIGNSRDFPTLTDVIPVFLKYHKTYGGIVRISIGPVQSLNVIDYDFLEFILSSPKAITKSKEYEFFVKWLGRGLLISTGVKWQKRRKLLTPAFHFQILEQFIDVFNGASDILVEQFKKQAENEYTDIYPYITLCALDVICETAMGCKINALLNKDSEYVKSVKEMGRIIVERAISPLKQFDCFYYFSKDYQKEQKALKVLHDMTNSMIQKRREELAGKSYSLNGYNEFGAKKRMAFLDLLIQSTMDGQPLSDEDIREEVDTFMFEGHDTTTSAISFILFNLAKYPQEQQKVYEEQMDIFEGDKTRPASYKDLQDMKYLEMVIKESLRLYPSVPMFNRLLDEDTEYKGKILPKGLTISIFAFGIQRNPEFFPNPDVFDPERFSIESKIKISKKPFCYIPFSAGHRNCIGQKFAMLEMKATLSKIIRNFLLSEVPGFEPILSYETILKSANGIKIKINKRRF